MSQQDAPDTPNLSLEHLALEQKRGFYKQVVDELNQRLKLQREDVFISLVGAGRDDWSFGNGDASLVKS